MSLQFFTNYQIKFVGLSSAVGAGDAAASSNKFFFGLNWLDLFGQIWLDFVEIGQN